MDAHVTTINGCNVQIDKKTMIDPRFHHYRIIVTSRDGKASVRGYRRNYEAAIEFANIYAARNAA